MTKLITRAVAILTLALAADAGQAAPSKCDPQAADLAAAYKKCADGCVRRDALHLAVMFNMAFDCMNKPGEPEHSKTAGLLWKLMEQWAAKDHPNWPNK